ncbi:transposon [Bordetella ansorpii]|uniref:Transposon n=1 Tax=Bordetella ansorpii TaxID=288768 RepID=A0A157SRI7_9BORD|nr:DUF2958 domain-containing protein [Bordetella ansorpii]SAI73118.1 transposon [Bordetella ansorpii]
MNALITPAEHDVLAANGHLSRQDPSFDPMPVLKLFRPDANATWLLTETDPDDADRAYGLCDLGQGTPELGWVSLQELMEVLGPMRMPIARDMYFVPRQTLSAYARDAQRAGSIVM